MTYYAALRAGTAADHVCRYGPLSAEDVQQLQEDAEGGSTGFQALWDRLEEEGNEERNARQVLEARAACLPSPGP